MGLSKSILLPNGITTDYHRISAIKLDCPYGISITVSSYITQNDRERQKKLESGDTDENTVFPYMDCDFITMPYDLTSDILNGPILSEAYLYIKTLDKYKDAKDV